MLLSPMGYHGKKETATLGECTAVFAHFMDNLGLQSVCKVMVEPLRLFHPTIDFALYRIERNKKPMNTPTPSFARVRWNKRSGSTKRESDSTPG